MCKQFDFREQFKKSESEQVRAMVVSELSRRFADVEMVDRAGEQDDRTGTDYWIVQGSGKRISVDVKVRDMDPIPKYGQDDLALETWSDVGNRVGWTRDSSKQTDYVLWVWTDTGRTFLVSFPALCSVFRRHWREWLLHYRSGRQQNPSWISECVFVPRGVVLQMINEEFCKGNIE